MIALVAGATRGTGRGIAVALGATGATVYCTGRSTREGRSEMNRPETIEETAELVTAAGGAGIPVRTDFLEPDQVAALAERVRGEQGRLDVLVNDVWGGDHLWSWNTPVWEHDQDKGLRLLRLAVDTHLISARHLLPLLIGHEGGLVVEVTDGTWEFNQSRYRENVYYDLAKMSVNRLGFAWSNELRPHGGTGLTVTPGFLRSEAMLDNFGVTEDNWREAEADPSWMVSETPAYLGRGVAALALDPDRRRWSGRSVSSEELAQAYGVTDVDGSRPRVWSYITEVREKDGERAWEDYR
ncbi:NAD(P)-dependent dehydrogenase (short-subunit alcohol dehydrogenase family) [Nonomuraea thailandensis]|uniref:NAD(P)-dependent dehydrogenase (Short-subunit alcohol dehydrogenase family) n=1 Tax=Nonomuraea thailandensis TaxID=1188745 RepID=A0A9X2GN21_9ACTN|nr:SDR family oxidoreductase [Nonomuraea thailandensis]MCP2358621.1 NAD(P)-dependent dehydrogenase (short-subunit alcohol dehydrogenase family) [Nonomuraea thailandensis]